MLALAAMVVGGLAVVSGFFWLVYNPKPEEGYTDMQKAQEINCVNNMKQIGLCFRMWAGDNGDKNPFNVSTNQGGSMELCAVGKDGFDRNAWQHLLCMSNELSTPRVLACPKDPEHKYADGWAHLGATNVSYLVRSGTNIDETNPTNILAVCPVDGNTLYCDGHVVEGKHKYF
ncbi:hypothetical protein Cflav_PD3423 [Pedosphaera parvula Ellin514]|uniref:Uncharacterized protein n=2 Tax=Pedosphaera TaxID=1032526 RepID=B9XHW0_PEDPL|nr:hypothetical protein Cflav_PD3423 [Pedosphaera parvula Ellin514]